MEWEAVEVAYMGLLVLLVLVPTLCYHCYQRRRFFGAGAGSGAEVRLGRFDDPLNCFYIGVGWALADKYGGDLAKVSDQQQLRNVVNSDGFRMGRAVAGTVAADGQEGVPCRDL